LGEDFLSSFDVEFDLANGVVRLWQPKDCDGASLAYWTRDVAGEVAIEAVTDMRRKIAFAVHLNGKRVHAMLDSGASTSIVSKHDAEAVGATPAGTTIGSSAWARRPSRHGSASSITSRSATRTSRCRDSRFGHLPGSDLRGDRQQNLEERVRGAAHAARRRLPAAHRTLVSHSQRKMYFTYVGGPVFVTGRTKPPAQPPSGEKPKGD
jgi:hypothetical protein